MSAIQQAQSIREVVEIINKDESLYIGGTDIRSADMQAAEYAFEATKDDDRAVKHYSRADNVEAALDYLVEQGARFNFHKAFDLVFQIVNDLALFS